MAKTVACHPETSTEKNKMEKVSKKFNLLLAILIKTPGFAGETNKV